MEYLTSEAARWIVILPAYNEAARIAPVIEKAKEYLPVLVVDDGSRDDTAQVARAAGANVLLQKPNAGKGAALRAGFRQALQMGCEAVITLDADGQHDPAEIPAFIQRYGQHAADLIIGARNFNQMPFSRRLANWSGGLLFSWAMGQKIQDNQSGYRMISRRMMSALLNSTESGFEFEVEMIMRCLKNGWSLDWVPIRTIYADQGNHIRPGKHIINFFRVVRKARRELRQK